MKYVIIGASAAGLAAAEAVRKEDPQGTVTILTEEAYMPYSRPSISYYLKGKVKESDMALRKPYFYKEKKIDVVTNAKVTAIDTEKKTVSQAEKAIRMTSFVFAPAQSRLCRLWRMLRANQTL